MKSIRSTILYLALVSVIVTSCQHDEFFELTNPPQFPWLNITEFERAAVSPYNYAFFSEWGGHFAVADRVIFDAKTDFIYHIPGSSANYPVMQIYDRQTSQEIQRASASFQAGYRAIGIANAALDFYFYFDTLGLNCFS